MGYNSDLRLKQVERCAEEVHRRPSEEEPGSVQPPCAELVQCLAHIMQLQSLQAGGIAILTRRITPCKIHFLSDRQSEWTTPACVLPQRTRPCSNRVAVQAGDRRKFARCMRIAC